MRILMTTDTMGGVWTYTRELSTQFLCRGSSVALVSFGRAPTATQRAWVDDQAAQWGGRFTFVVSETPLEWMRENAGAYSLGAPLLLDLAESFGAELLLSSQYCFGALPCAIPRIVVAHSDVLSWAEACGKAPLEPSEWLTQYCALVSEGLRRADAVVAPAAWMLHALADHFQIPREAKVIANGRTLPGIRTDGRRRLQAVTAGRVWDEGKNVQMLADVAPILPMLVAGELGRDRSRFPRMHNRPYFLGLLTEERLIELFQMSSMYICTSRYEPFGLAPLEAALCGCAVVANDIPSLREVWGGAALFFDGAESLSSLLAELCHDGALLNETRERALARAREFTADRMAVDYLHLFDSLQVASAAA